MISRPRRQNSPEFDDSRVVGAIKTRPFRAFTQSSAIDFGVSMLLDDRDRAILHLLQAEGRLTNAELADRVSLSPSACLRRVRALEQTGLIEGYVALIDARVVGLGGVAFVLVTLDQQGRSALDRFEKAVGRHREILECYLLAGSADYLIRVVFADAQDFERVHTTILTQLPGVTRLQSTLALRTVKKTTSLPL